MGAMDGRPRSPSARVKVDMTTTRATPRPRRRAVSGSSAPSMAFDPVETVIAAVREGRMVLVADDDQRENEGDLIVAAEKVRDTDINFMARYGRGLICVALTPERLRRFGIARMPVKGGGDQFQTAFMESIDAAANVTTGISAFDRAQTVRVLMDEHTGPRDVVSPGHLFPLEAVQGGVLRRPGHTEAAVDLSVLAGLKPGGVICEVLREDGRAAQLPELIRFARRHRVPITSVAELVAYRRRTEVLVDFVREVSLPTAHGEFALRLYHARLTGEHHVALVRGALRGGDPVLVRMHSECLTGDVFGSARCDCGQQLDAALARIAEIGRGAVVYLRQEGRGIGLANKIHAYALQEAGLDTVEANRRLGFAADLRTYDEGVQILKELGVEAVRLMTNNPAKVNALERAGMRVTERVPLRCDAGPHNARYLQTKREKLGHLL